MKSFATKHCWLYDSEPLDSLRAADIGTCGSFTARQELLNEFHYMCMMQEDPNCTSSQYRFDRGRVFMLQS